MIKDKNTFAFHISHPNNEDVDPLIFDKWIAVADGMGGTGCMPHEVDLKYRESLRAILGYVIPEYSELLKDGKDLDLLHNYLDDDAETGELSYLHAIFEPCIEKEANTSARWASRVVMTRFLYYLLAYDDIKGLKEFIGNGLKAVKKVLNFSVDDRNKEVMPTTFVAATYIDSKDDAAFATAYVFWAGDSRCYLLDKSGLRQLSEDDEDESKGLTNYISADSDFILHHRGYKLEKPFALICASDGFFDAYKHDLEVEYWLLENVNNANSFEELCDLLENRYNTSNSDDTSVAFLPIGESDYSEFKNMLVDRYELVKNLYDRHEKYAPIVAIIDGKSGEITVKNTEDRFISKFGKILDLLVDAYYAGEEDLLLTPTLKGLIQATETECKNEYINDAKVRREELKGKIAEKLKQLRYADCFLDAPVSQDNIVKLLEDYKALDRKIADELTNESRYEKARDDLYEEGKNILRDIRRQQKEKIAKIVEALESENEGDLKEQTWQTCEERKRLVSELDDLIEAERTFSKEKNDDKILLGKRFAMRNKVIEYRKRFADNSSDLTKVKKVLDELNSKREKQVNSILKYLDAILNDRQSVFTREFISELNMDCVLSNNIPEDELHAKTKGIFVSKNASNDDLSKGLLEVYKKETDGTSCIDDVIFSSSKLIKFRMYYKYSTGLNRDEIDKYNIDMQKYEEGLVLPLKTDKDDDESEILHSESEQSEMPVQDELPSETESVEEAATDDRDEKESSDIDDNAATAEDAETTEKIAEESETNEITDDADSNDED